MSETNFTWPQVVNGRQFTGADFEPYNYQRGLPNLLGHLAAEKASDQGVNARTEAQAAAAAAVSARQAAEAAVGQVTVGSTQSLAFPEAVANLVTASDVQNVFLYDTRLDSDGGAWTERCTGTSWWQEALNTATRGAKRSFPKVALLVLRNSAIGTLTIYDALDLDAQGVPRLWMRWDGHPNSALRIGLGFGTITNMTRVAGLNGHIVVTSGITGGSGQGTAVLIDLAADQVFVSLGTRFRWPLDIARRNVQLAGWPGGTTTQTVPGGTQPDRNALDVAMRVLPGAPLHPVSGLPLPTIVTATIAGAAVWHPTGLASHITVTSGYVRCAFLDDGRLALSRTDAALVEVGPIPYAPSTASSAWRTGTIGDVASGTPTIRGVFNGAAILGPGAIGTLGTEPSNAGLTHLAEDPANLAGAMVCYVRSDRCTGWMLADQRGAWFADTATGALVGGDTVADRSAGGVPLVVTGALSRVAANGGDVVLATGWSAANYAEAAYSAQHDFGTGDFAFACWLTATGIGALLERGTPAGAAVGIYLTASGVPAVRVRNAGGTNFFATPAATRDVRDGMPRHLVVGRRGGLLELWLDGVRLVNTSRTEDLNNASGVLRLGGFLDGTQPWQGGIALPRVFGAMPSPTQIEHMFRDERLLFAVGARCTLGGTFNAVRDLDRSRWSGRLAVATQGGVSVFDGLVRADYLTGGAAMASDNVRAVAMEAGIAAFATVSNAGFRRGAITGLDRMDSNMPGAVPVRAIRAWGRTADATPLDLAPRVFVGERETLTVLATIVGRTLGSDTERLRYVRRATLFRDPGGNVTLQGSVETIGTDAEATATADATLVLDTTAQTLAARVTGVSGKTIWWQARFDVERVSEAARYEEVDA